MKCLFFLSLVVLVAYTECSPCKKKTCPTKSPPPPPPPTCESPPPPPPTCGTPPPPPTPPPCNKCGNDKCGCKKGCGCGGIGCCDICK